MGNHNLSQHQVLNRNLEIFIVSPFFQKKDNSTSLAGQFSFFFFFVVSVAHCEEKRSQPSVLDHFSFPFREGATSEMGKQYHSGFSYVLTSVWTLREALDWTVWFRNFWKKHKVLSFWNYITLLEDNPSESKITLSGA